MKKTAVEWLVEQLENHNGVTRAGFKKCIQEAKEIEKEQMWKYIKNYYVNGENSLLFHKNEFEQYYNETFKNTEK